MKQGTGTVFCWGQNFGKPAAWSGEQWKGVDKELHVQKGTWGVKLVPPK